MLFRSKKINSATWRDPSGTAHKVELLGSGQQFMATGVHPDTGKPIRWPNGCITETEPWELIELDHDEVVTWFAEELPSLIPGEWVSDKSGNNSNAITPTSSDPLDNIRPTLDITIEKIEAALSCLDPDMHHDEWAKVGMALHHQFGGSETGLLLWKNWSQKGAKFDPKLLQLKWRTFSDDGSKRTVTMASVLKMAHETDAWGELVKAEKVKVRDDYCSRIRECEDPHDIEGISQDVAQDSTLTIVDIDRKSTRLNSSHIPLSRMPSSA